MTELGERIRQLREKKGLTQSQLAREAEISSVHLGRIEKGESQPTFDVALNIAKVLDKPLSALAGDITEMVYALVLIDVDDEVCVERLSAHFTAMSIVSQSYSFRRQKKILLALSTPKFEEIGEFVLDHCMILRGIANTDTIFILKNYINSNSENYIRSDELENEAKQAYIGFVMLPTSYKNQEKVANMVKEVPGVKQCFAVSGDKKDILAICHAGSSDELRNVYKLLQENLEEIDEGHRELIILDNLDENS